MGVDFRDLDNDGWEDLVITALSNQTFPVFRNLGRGLFSDVTYPSHAGVISAPLSGWSMGIFDFDNDGWKDVFVAAGDVQDNTELLSSGKSRQQNLLMLNDGRGAFRGAFDRTGRTEPRSRVRRFRPRWAGGRRGHPPQRAARPAPQHHGRRQPLARASTRRHARATATASARASPSGAAALTQVNHVTTSTGYACSSELAVHFGLGRSTHADSIEIEWPSGSRQTLTNVAADSFLTVRELR